MRGFLEAYQQVPAADLAESMPVEDESAVLPEPRQSSTP